MRLTNGCPMIANTLIWKEIGRLLPFALTSLLLCAELAAQPVANAGSPEAERKYHVDVEPVSGGAELVTIFGTKPGAGGQADDVPLVSVLRDTLGAEDPASARLRYVWILTTIRPTALQRFVSAVSFAYFRAGTSQHADRVPSPVLDLAAPAKRVLPNLLSDGLQALELDPMGAPIRASTRSYRGNSSDYHQVQVFQALNVLDGLARQPDGRRALSDTEIEQIYSRLSLSNRTFGGLVRQENLPRFYDKQTTEQAQNRGHNWELLRQRAELNGLYFDPLAAGDGSPAEALVWVARHDLEQSAARHFNPKFLSIADPWTDPRLFNWKGYSQTFYFDAENRRVPPDTPGAHGIEMIPLAFYSLDYPHVPLLLADFRTSQPKRRELVRHGISSVLLGVLDVARFTNWPYLAANTTWTFVRGRQGGAVNRSGRLEAYSGARTFLSSDSSLDPKLRAELARRVDALALNPLENRGSTEVTAAKEQYAALLQYATEPAGLDAKLARDRANELDSYTRSTPGRMLARLGRLFSETPRADSSRAVEVNAELESYRRSASDARFLDQLLASSPRPEIQRSTGDIRSAVDGVAQGPEADRRAPALIAQVFERSEDPDVRVSCLRALGRMASDDARNQLRRISQDPRSTESWRTLALLYLNGDIATGPVAERGAESGTE